MKGKTRGDQPVHAVDAVYFQDAELGTLGLTKREYFAGLAMQSAISRMDMSGNDFGVYTKNVAINAVTFADALIAELSKEEE